MNLHLQLARAQTRRQFLKNTGLGAIALAGLLRREARADKGGNPLSRRELQFAPKATTAISLHMPGAPPQHELFDYKPKLVELHMKPCPDELLKNQRFPFIKGHP